MRLEIRDIESSMVYDIGPDGAVLGRERAKTDISLRDESISKRHARIFMDAGGWFLEDLNSSNGTYLDEQRITAPVELLQGVMFSLAQRKFEVVFMDGASASTGNGAMDDFPPPAGLDDEPGAPAFGRTSSPAFDDDFGAAPGPAGGGDDEMPQGEGFGYFMVAVPKAVAYYMANVPLMAVNPLGSIRKGAEEQRLEAKSKMEVAAYAIPAGVVGPLIGGLAGVIAALINGVFAFGAIIALLPSAAIGGVVGGVFGYFMHPIVGWIVNFLKGESTPRSRTNFAIGSYTLGLLTAVPNAIGVIVAALPIPFINLLGPLLTLVVTLISLFFFYTWVKAFNLVRWMRYVVLVLGALAVLGTAAGFVTGAYSQLMAFIDGTPTTTTAEMGDTGDVDVGDIELSEEQQAAIAALPEEQRAAVEEQYKRAMAAAKAASAKAAAAAAAANANADAAEDAAEDAAAAVDDSTDDTDDSDADDTAAVAVDDANARAVETPPPVAPGEINTAEHPLGITPFVQYLQKRDAVERAVSDKPSLLKNRTIKREYEQLWEKTYDIRKKYSKKRGSRFERDKLFSRQKGQEIMEKTVGHVDKLYAEIFQ